MKTKIVFALMAVFLLSIAGISSVVTADRTSEENEMGVYHRIFLLANRALKAVKYNQIDQAIVIIENIIDYGYCEMEIIEEDILILHELLVNCDPWDHEQIEYLQMEIQDLEIEMNQIQLLIAKFDCALNELIIYSICAEIDNLNAAGMYLRQAITFCLTLIKK